MTAPSPDTAADLKQRIAELERQVQRGTAENARLAAEAQQAVERQTATADVLKVIASSPNDVQPVFDAIVSSAARLFQPCSATITTLKDGKLHWNASQAALSGFHNEQTKLVYPLPFDPERSPSSRAILERRIIEITDALSPHAPEYTRKAAAAGGFRSATFVPLIHQGKGIGALILGHPEVGFRLSDKQLALVQTFADQAVIAIENARLFDEVQQRTADLTEALTHQTGSANILKVIASSPTDVEPVLRSIVESACELCVADDALVSLRDGDELVFNAQHGSIPVVWRRQPIDRDAAAGAAVLDRVPVHVHDLRSFEGDRFPRAREFSLKTNVRTVLCVPLLREGESIGVIVLRRTEVRPFTDKQIGLLQTFADQAVIALGNVRLFDEVEAKTRDLEESLQQQTATADVLKVISRSAFDLQTVLETLIKSAVELSGANRGSIFLREGDLFPLKAAFSTTPEFLRYWAANPPRAGRGSATSRVIASGKVEIIPDVLDDPEMQMPAGSLARIRAALGVPMLRDNKVEGVLVLTRPEPGPFTKSQIDLVQTFADQAVIAVENARLFDEVQQRTRELTSSLEELRATQDRLIQTEKLASLGQLTAGIAHEIKNPLNFINNFAALSAELTDELNETLAPAALAGNIRIEVDELTGLLKDNLQKVVQHGKRADSIVKNMLLHSREGSGEHRPTDINALVEESLNLAYHGARAEKSQFDVTLKRELDPAAGMAELFPQEITRVLLNLISNGFYAVAKRSTEDGNAFEPVLSASTHDRGARVEIRIRDNGTGIPPEVREKMFNPFFTTKPAGEGTGLGLSMSHDIIVKQHGGTIDVDTAPGKFTEFTILLPRKSNFSDQT